MRAGMCQKKIIEKIEVILLNAAKLDTSVDPPLSTELN
jgi:hypothetical protein